MKKLITLSVLALSGLVPLNAQIQKDYIAKSKEPNANFFKIVKETEAKFAQNKSAKSGSSISKEEKKAIKQYLRWKYNYLYRIGSDGKIPSDLTAYYNAGLLDQNGKMQAKQMQASDPNNIYAPKVWTNVGPQTTPNANTYSNYPQMGRVNELLYLHNSNNQNGHVLFVAAPGGGVWRSLDDGTSWSNLLENYAALAATDVKAAPDVTINNYTTRSIYVSMGDFDSHQSSASIGVIKSTDGGVSFSSTGLSYPLSDQKKTSNLIVIDDNTVLVGDDQGIKRTTDGGTTWTLVYAHADNMGRLTKSGQNIIAGSKKGAIALSTNNGLNWTEIRAESPAGNEGEGDRHTFAVNANGQFYALDRIGQLKRLITTTNPTNNTNSYSWEDVGNPPPIVTINGSTSKYDSQDGYDQTLVIDGDRIIIGGVDVYHTSDNAVTWHKSLNGYWDNNASDGSYVHSDHHAMGKPARSR